MWYISFKIHYANNDVHMEAFGVYPREMYRDFNSYFEFAYGNGNWKYRMNRLIFEIAIWLILSTLFIFIKRTRISKYQNENIIDQ
ncbi:hypothetical protein Fluta_1279 [Fluviicola taffensis DSM 16823]|uniref:Uncharacterized protein n=2 Tax=Fluviicola TaxID=332102 RepID=F2IC48_FLUTR|nr:hypothetical protein Fluta_1279 [Fluviicola taffensis DSM 16823]